MRRFNKGILSIVTVALFCCTIGAQTKQQDKPEEKIPAGSRVFIAPMGEFDTYLRNAIKDKKVPLEIVDDKSKADFEITGVSESQKASTAKKTDIWKLAFERRGEHQCRESKIGCDGICVFGPQR